jgi:threonine dehydrogenase-like Zn-dependent dehydrogenase
MRAVHENDCSGSTGPIALDRYRVTFHDPDFHRRELTLLASRNAADEDFAHVIAMLEAGKIDLAPWITHRVGSEQLAAKFPHWLQPDSSVVKAMLEFA